MRLALLSLFCTLSSIGLSQHPILKSIGFSGKPEGVFIDLVIGGGNTCNGINIYHRTKDQVQFRLAGQIAGICGHSSNDTRYTFLHEEPEAFDSNYYYLDFGGVGPSSVVPFYFIDFESDNFVVLQSSGNFQLFTKAPTFQDASVEIVSLHGKVYATANLKNGIGTLSISNRLFGQIAILTITGETGLRYVEKRLIIQ